MEKEEAAARKSGLFSSPSTVAFLIIVLAVIVAGVVDFW